MKSSQPWLHLSQALPSSPLPPVLVPFVFQGAAAAPGITSRCRNDRGGKRSALLASASAKGGNPFWKPPRTSPLVSSPVWARRLFDFSETEGWQGKWKDHYGLISQALLRSWRRSHFALSAEELNKIGALLARKGGGMGVGEIATMPPPDTMIFFLQSLAHS